MRYLLLAITVLMLFGLIVLPGLANEPMAPLPPQAPAAAETSLRASAQITFTPVATLYFPVIFIAFTPVEISDLLYTGLDEYIEIKNNGPDPQSMDGWSILSVAGMQTYNFPPGVTLEVGQFVRIHSGRRAVANPPTDLLWTNEGGIWRNNGDIAVLYDDQGVIRDGLCYGDRCP